MKPGAPHGGVKCDIWEAAGGVLVSGPGFHMSRACGTPGFHISHAFGDQGFTFHAPSGDRGFTFHAPSGDQGFTFHVPSGDQGFTFHGPSGDARVFGGRGFTFHGPPGGRQGFTFHAGPSGGQGFHISRAFAFGGLRGARVSQSVLTDGIMSTNQSILTGKHMRFVVFVTNLTQILTSEVANKACR